MITRVDNPRTQNANWSTFETYKKPLTMKSENISSNQNATTTLKEKEDSNFLNNRNQKESSILGSPFSGSQNSLSKDLLQKEIANTDLDHLRTGTSQTSHQIQNEMIS